MIKRYVTSILTLLCCTAVFAQEGSTEFLVDYRVNSSKIETGFRDNADKVSEIISHIQQYKQGQPSQTGEEVNLIGIRFCGSASPEGNHELNERLAKQRRISLENLIRSRIQVPDSLVTYDDAHIPWDNLSSQVKASDISQKDEIIEIINKDYGLLSNKQSDERRIADLKVLDGGKAWQEMNRRFFANMRNASVVFITFSNLPPSLVDIPIEDIPDEPLEFEDLVLDDEPLSVEPMEVPDIWHRYLTLKTNFVGWGLAIANLGVEIDLGRHWSFTLPIYFSTWDYFKSDYKFNTFAIQPEIRYWFSTKKDQCNDRWFVGAHFGLAYYNLAAGSDYRFQDADRESPALGGGLALGYRLPLGKKKHWRMEFTVGGGCYKLEFDKFRNETNGLLVETGVEKTYWGLDMAAINFSYSFNLNKKGGKR